MLSRYVKFAASTVLTPGRIGSLPGVQKHRHGMSSTVRNQYTHEVRSKIQNEPFMSVMYNESEPEKFENTRRHSVKVTILGANGAVGQMLSLFLKQCPLIETLSLYDIVPVTGTALDISHIDTSCKVFAYTGPDRLKDALKNTDIVIISAGVPSTFSKPKAYLFCKNAAIVYDLVECCCHTCPKALIGVLTDPINSMVPLTCEVLKRHGNYDVTKVFGIAASHVVRASTFVAERMCLDPTSVIVPVIGGCSSSTIVPVLSQTKPNFNQSSSFFSEEVFKLLVGRIRNATEDVIRAKKGFGAPSLSTAYSAARFTHSLAKGLCGKQAIECAFVYSNVLPTCPYLTTPVELGPGGVQKNCGLPTLTKFETTLLDEAISQIVTDVKLGMDIVTL